jgi:hypothetical protein
MNINEQYQAIIRKCKFISKPDEWFVENTEAILEGAFSYNDYTEDYKFNDGWSLFNGMTNEASGYEGELPREDSETCPFSEFWIYDEFGNEISELTLNEYKQLLRKKKLEKIIELNG